jgi:hypothetical protein
VIISLEQTPPPHPIKTCFSLFNKNFLSNNMYVHTLFYNGQDKKSLKLVCGERERERERESEGGRGLKEQYGKIFSE